MAGELKSDTGQSSQIFCDGCYDCLAGLMGELKESNEGNYVLDDETIEQHIRELSSIDDVNKSERSKTKTKLYIKDHLLSIIIGIQMLYAGLRILMLLSSVASVKLTFLINPFVLYEAILYVFIIFFGINFFREKSFAWYGVTGSFLLLIYRNLLGLLSQNIILMAAGLCFSVFVLWLLLKNDTLDRLKIKMNSKLILMLITTGIVIIASALYFGVGVLLLKLAAH